MTLKELSNRLSVLMVSSDVSYHELYWGGWMINKGVSMSTGWGHMFGFSFVVLQNMGFSS